MMKTTTRYGTPNQQPDKEKMQELILYLSVQSTDDSSWGVTKLNKLLFLIDFSAYLFIGRSITGHEYQRKQHGPCPTQISSLREGLVADKRLEIEKVRYYNYNKKVPVARRDANMNAFTPDELDMIDSVRKRWLGVTASEMSTKSHDFLGWKTAEHGATIPYSFALIEPRREPTCAEIEYAKMLGSIPIEERRKV